ncbi:MAG: cysteine desulfurase [Prolixibacteraceae bacterium]|jgi:cysteine desulfurase/selenocysteine lyase|nr:cysteine desulfurase [Prolixibacteraceae bacterium]
MNFDPLKIRQDFPILQQKIYNKPLIYFDSAASTQRPLAVQEKIRQIDREYYGNIHRAVHYMADKATADYEMVREKVRSLIHAGTTAEIIFTKGTTESVNLVAYAFGEAFVSPGDEIIVSEMEHHSNIVPWQLMAGRKGAAIVMLPFNDRGELELDKLPGLISEKTKLIAVTHVSNVLGTVNPVARIAAMAHARGVKIFVDGAQAIQHLPVDVQALDVDFYAFSAHKMYGPNGVGVLYGKKELLRQMPPYQGGGEMISEVRFSGTTFNELPYKFEAGTPNITGVIGLGAAIGYLQEAGIDNVSAHEQALLKYATEKLMQVPGMKIYGESKNKSGVISFNVEGIHSFDLGTMLDKMGIAVRTGHHCADPVMQHFDIPGTVRMSFGIYNTREEIDAFLPALRKVISLF